MANSPTSRTLKLLRDRGYRCAVVEQTIPKTFIKRDLYGCWDILAIRDGETMAVQVTSGSNLSHRAKKIAEAESTPEVRKCGWTLMIHGWRKNSKGKWVVREVDVS